MRTARLLLVLSGIAVLSGAPTRARAQQTAPPPSTPPPAPASQPGTAAKNHNDVDYPENDDSLGLSQDQKDRIKAIRDDSALQLKDAQKDTTLTEDQRERGELKDACCLHARLTSDSRNACTNCVSSALVCASDRKQASYAEGGR